MATQNDTNDDDTHDENNAEVAHGGRTRGGEFAAGRSVEPPKPTVDIEPHWGWGSLEPNDRALDLVDAAGHGGYEIRAVRGDGCAGLQLVDTTGSTPNEFLRNVEGQPLLYATKAEAEGDIGRLIELAEERQNEMDNDQGMSR